MSKALVKKALDLFDDDRDDKLRNLSKSWLDYYFVFN
jgi:hypothetical protein